jgi:hypothetical protein
MNDIHWAPEIFRGFVTLGAALAAVYVSHSIGKGQLKIGEQQARTAVASKHIAAAKLNLELFEERYAIFLAVWKFLTDQLTGLHEQKSLISPDFTNLIPKARFLFGNGIGDYMEDAFKKRVQLMTLIRQHNRDLDNPTIGGQTIGSLELWFADEATNCFKRFADYLDFSRWKLDPLARLADPS